MSKTKQSNCSSCAPNSYEVGNPFTPEAASFGKERCKPYGPEWDFVGYMAANGCRAGYKCVQCQHSRYLGDKKDCCFGIAPSDPKATCNPKYTMDNTECDAVYAEKCTGESIFSDEKCRTWAEKKPAVARPLIRSYCLKNVADTRCQDWFKANVTQDDNVGESEIRAYCLRNPTDPFCDCLTSKVNTIKGGNNPRCIDANCMKNGYYTVGMKSVCPNITNIDCSLQYDYENAGVALAAAVINQNCGTNEDIADPVTGVTPPSKGKAPTNKNDPTPAAPKPTETDYSWLYVLLFLIMITVAIVFYRRMSAGPAASFRTPMAGV